jgi:hypothetical protein
MIFQARDPRTALPMALRHALAPRPKHSATSRYLLLQCMPPHNGLEPLIAAAEAELRKSQPQATIDIAMRRDFMIDDAAERDGYIARYDAVILFAGPAATSVHVTWKFASALEQAGLPVALSVPQPLAGVAHHEIALRGARLRHALAPGTPDSGYVAALIDALHAPLSKNEQDASPYQPFTPDRYATSGTLAEITRHFETEGMTDGLPIAIPTDDAVQDMLAGTRRAPNEIVCATLRPEGVPVTVEQVAINAVMAGAEPLHLPVILAAISLFGALELESMTRSVNSFAFTHLVNGPLAQQLGIASGTNALGAGNKANAVISRAIGLVLRNGGWLRVGASSTPCQGNAAGIMVVAENEAASPWPAMHTALGYTAGDNVLSLFVGGLGIVGNYYYRGLADVARQLTEFENKLGALLLVSAKRARELAESGLSREALVETLHQQASAPLGQIRKDGFFPMMKALIARGPEERSWPKSYLTEPDSAVVPLYPNGGIKLAVVGDDIASVMQLWNSQLLASVRIDDWL